MALAPASIRVPSRRPSRFVKFFGPQFYLAVGGFAIFIGLWYALVHFQVWRFAKLPGPLSVVTEWTSREPVYGTSLFTPIYYQDIWASVGRVAAAFVLAIVLGVPLGILLGWNQVARDFLFPLLELIRPIPPMAWVPLAILMLSGQEPAMIFLTWIAAFFATVLNTMLGVFSIDEAYIRAAYCLGSRRSDVLWNVIVPGALPYIFTGLQIAMGVAWFSLVAGEMIAGEAGLGYLILNSYVQLQTTTIVIGMVTLGFVGYLSSALVRLAGRKLMAWQTA
ncbi:MAG: ABC transporter permease [Candidatus Eremiobacteraeota bacterium]|nr:ABC transporter permease [Candidatus Eremiobacteraeota bacterium]